MNKAHFIFRILFSMLLAMGVKAQVLGPDDHRYELVREAGISWEQARIKAAEKTFNGVHGHLVTIQSLEEDQLVEQLRAHPDFGVDGLLWVGGSDTNSP